MIKNLRWNFWISSFGMVLTLLFSLRGNLFLTSLTRALYCFIALFLISFLIRWFFISIFKEQLNVSAPQEEKSDEEAKGTHVDLSTPDEEDMLATPDPDSDVQEEQQFTPLSPPRFESKEQQVDAEEVVQAIRHMSEQ